MEMKYTAYIHSPMSIGLQSRMLLCSTPVRTTVHIGATYVDTVLHDNLGLIIYHMRSILRRCGARAVPQQQLYTIDDGIKRQLYRHFVVKKELPEVCCASSLLRELLLSICQINSIF